MEPEYPLDALFQSLWQLIETVISLALIHPDMGIRNRAIACREAISALHHPPPVRAAAPAENPRETARTSRRILAERAHVLLDILLTDSSALPPSDPLVTPAEQAKNAYQGYPDSPPATRLIRMILKRYSWFPGEDLVTVARLALLRAYHTFDPTKGFPFRVYAWFVVNNAVVDILRRECGLSRREIKLLKRLTEAEEELASGPGRRPSTADIARWLREKYGNEERDWENAVEFGFLLRKGVRLGAGSGTPAPISPVPGQNLWAPDLRRLVAEFAERELRSGRPHNALFLWAVPSGDAIASMSYKEFAVFLYERTGVNMTGNAIKTARCRMLKRLRAKLSRAGFDPDSL